MDILLVDDNPEYLEVVRDALESGGYTVHAAYDGMEACERLSSADIDIIISDIRMPRFDGIKLHAFARETEKYRMTKFIFLTGLKDYYSDLVTIDPAADFLLEKTIPIAEIVRFVDGLLFGKPHEVWA